MTYKEFIQNIIDTRGQWDIPEGEYWEGHHIVPICIGGDGDSRQKHPNIIRLFANEHYEAHKLLAQENPTNSALVYAFWRMSTTKTKTRDTHITISALDYKLAKELLRNLDRTQTQESNDRRANTLKSKNLKWYTNGQEELRAQQCPLGWTPGRCEKVKQAVKLANTGNSNHKGIKNGMFGKHLSKQHKQKLSDWSSCRRWFNNGYIEVFEQVCPTGFVKGRLKRNLKPKKMWYTNGQDNVFDYTCPDGFIPGKTKHYIPWNKGKKNVYSEETLKKMSDAMRGCKSLKNKVWINNGQVNHAVDKDVVKEYLQDGWVKGMLRRKKL